MGRLDLASTSWELQMPQEAGMVFACPCSGALPCPLTPQPGFCPSTASSGATLSRALEDTGSRRMRAEGPRSACGIHGPGSLSPVLPHPRQGRRG